MFNIKVYYKNYYELTKIDYRQLLIRLQGTIIAPLSKCIFIEDKNNIIAIMFLKDKNKLKYETIMIENYARKYLSKKE